MAPRKRAGVPDSRRTSLIPYKFVVSAVPHRVSGGKIESEVPLEPVAVFGVDGLIEWAEAFPERLRELEGKINSPSPG